jgi:polyisoprenoid-binding protein YceI
MQITRRDVLAGVLATTTLPRIVSAAPRNYRIAPEEAEIRFIFTANGTEQSGTAPLSRADLRIDPDNLQASTAEVTADLSRVRAGIILVTQALKSPSMLDTAHYPVARFFSTGVTLGSSGRLSDGATIRGDLTLKGLTRPVRLNAAVHRPPGTAPDELDQLQARLTGQISRKSYGISDFPAFVDDTVGLDIRVKIRAAS